MIDIFGFFKQPFQKMLGALRLRLKTLVPTKRYDDLTHEAQQKAFMVAGAQKAALLADLAKAVEVAAAEGKSVQWFSSNFSRIARDHGWSPRGAGDWHARIVYETNIMTSYGSGRLSQLKAFPFWIYRHSHLALTPRPHHLALDKIVKPQGDPFWRFRFPPRGYRCGCRVVGARDAAIAKRLGGDPSKQVPSWADQTDPQTGLPVGVDKGWGAALDSQFSIANLLAELIRHAAKFPEPLRSAFVADLMKASKL